VAEDDGSHDLNIDLALAIDEICREIYSAADRGQPVETAFVGEEIYGAVAETKAQQHTSRGNPLLLLALDVVEDDTLPPTGIRVG
jgi:hypothetical protein